MTEVKVKRYDALIALRRRDRSEALRALEEARRDADQIATEQAFCRTRIDALEKRLSDIEAAEATNAGRIAKRMDARRLAKHRLGKARRAAAALALAHDEATIRIDAAKDRVAKSQQALSALEKR